MTRTSLYRDIAKFLERHRMGRARFGHLCAGDPNIVREMELGRVPRQSTEAKIRLFMEEHDERFQKRCGS